MQKNASIKPADDHLNSIYDMSSLFCLSSNTGHIAHVEEIKHKFIRYAQYFNLDENIDIKIPELIHTVLKVMLSLLENRVTMHECNTIFYIKDYLKRLIEESLCSTSLDPIYLKKSLSKTPDSNSLRLVSDSLLSTIRMKPYLIPQYNAIQFMRLNLSSNL